MKLPALIVAAGLMSFGSVASAPAEATVAQAPDQASVLAAVHDVTVYVSCRGGLVRWSASYSGAPNTTYPLYAMEQAGSAGDFDWQYQGVTSSGSAGIGSTNTFTSSSNGGTSAKVQVKVGDGVGEATTPCSP